MTALAYHMEIESKLNKIRWHIENNFLPRYPKKTIDGMISTIRSYVIGRIGLNDPIVSRSEVTVNDLLEDLRIDPETLSN